MPSGDGLDECPFFIRQITSVSIFSGYINACCIQALLSLQECQFSVLSRSFSLVMYGKSSLAQPAASSFGLCQLKLYPAACLFDLVGSLKTWLFIGLQICSLVSCLGVLTARLEMFKPRLCSLL